MFDVWMVREEGSQCHGDKTASEMAYCLKCIGPDVKGHCAIYKRVYVCNQKGEGKNEERIEAVSESGG